MSRQLHPMFPRRMRVGGLGQWPDREHVFDTAVAEMMTAPTFVFLLPE
ncbi:hypothetical protein AB0K12_47575 [Nonomuraea sp. NPDC049419]